MLNFGLQEDGKSVEFTLEGCCLVCAGQLRVRLTQVGAVSCCRHCRWISRTSLKFRDGALTVAYNSPGRA